MDVLHSPIPLTRVSLLEDRTDLMSTYKEPPFPATSLLAMKPPSIIYPAYYLFAPNPVPIISGSRVSYRCSLYSVSQS